MATRWSNSKRPVKPKTTPSESFHSGADPGLEERAILPVTTTTVWMYRRLRDHIGGWVNGMSVSIWLDSTESSSTEGVPYCVLRMRNVQSVVFIDLTTDLVKTMDRLRKSHADVS